MSEWIVSAASSAVSPVSQRPGARLLLAGGEERDQIERVAQPAHDLLERRGAAVAERGRLLVVELGELGLEREVDPAGAVLDRDQRLRRQRLELGRQLARVLGERRLRSRCARAPCRAPRPRARSFGSPDFACFSTRSSRRSTWSRSATSSSSRSVLEVARRDRRRGEKPSRTTSSASTCRRLPSSAGPVPGTSWTRIAAGVTFFADDHLARARRAAVGDRRHADVRLAVLAAAGPSSAR